MQNLRRFLPVLVLLLLAAAAYGMGWHAYLSFDALQRHRALLQGFVSDHFVLAVLTFVAVYAGTVAISIPGASVLTVTGGFLFGVMVGGSLVVLAATIGASVIFMVARHVAGNAIRRKAGPFIQKMEEGFRKDAISYLLFLRLVPVFPFWVVNLVPGIAGVPLRVFVLTTAIGIVPGTFVYAAFGAGLGQVFERGEGVSLQGVLSPTLIAAFVGLGLLALLPIVIKRWRQP
jgi:uncharacterized membrane protein YdjX (TVP38/TMEM64 family)